MIAWYKANAKSSCPVTCLVVETSNPTPARCVATRF